MSKNDHSNPAGGLRCTETGIPWTRPETWAEANGSLYRLCAHHQPALAPLLKMADDLKACLLAVFPILDTLCSRTCPVCEAPCCDVATVWYDFKDLIFMHLAQTALPLVQLARSPGEPCRCCSRTGCRLPRLSRPWTCTWYLCPAQKHLLSEMPGSSLETVEHAMLEIKRLRNRLETDFIRITS